MSLRKPRLSISNSVLSTAVDWAVVRKLYECNTPVSSSTLSLSAASTVEHVVEEPSPFWIPSKSVYMLSMLMQKEGQTSHPVPVDLGGCMDTSITTSTTTQRSGSAKPKRTYYLKRRWRTVNVFGVSFVNAADTPVCSLIDSCTCAFPLSESGDIIWSLVGKVRSLQTIKFSSPQRASTQTSAPRNDGFLSFAHPFESPYWIESEGLEERWNGVTIAPNAMPVCINRDRCFFFNAEQTSNASRFDSLSCTPHRRHQCLLKNGVYWVSLNFSVKLAKAVREMSNTSTKASLAETNTPWKENTTWSNSSTTGPRDHHSFHKQEKEKEEHEETGLPSNLWVDLELIEKAGWSLRDGAVGVELPTDTLMITLTSPPAAGTINTPTARAKSVAGVVVVNAEFIRERDSLLDIITYTPQYIGLGENSFLGSEATVRLALVARMMNYTSTKWICAQFAEKAGLCGKKGNNATAGVEVTLHRRPLSTAPIVVINADELDVTQERIAELQSQSG